MMKKEIIQFLENMDEYELVFLWNEYCEQLFDWEAQIFPIEEFDKEAAR